MFRFSLRWLLAIVSLLCFGLAALRNPTEVMSVAMAAVLVLSTLFAVVSAAANRSAFASAYAGSVLVVILITGQTLAMGTLPADRLIQKAIAYFLDLPEDVARRAPTAPLFLRHPADLFWQANHVYNFTKVWRFRGIARGLLALGTGLVAGAAAHYLTRTKASAAPTNRAVRCGRSLELQWLLGFLAVLVLGGFALRVGSELCLSIVFIATAGLLLVSAIRAIAFGQSAPVSLGTALVGGTYLALSILTLTDSRYGVRMPTETVTSYGLAETFDLPVETLSWGGLQQDRLPLWQDSPGWHYAINVHRIALLLWSAVMGLTGGLGVAVLQERSRHAGGYTSHPAAQIPPHKRNAQG